ncbi:NAD(P)-dependent oxidoreductase [Candidatus Microgenomates bacterium]|nr:NAD(P)-dependent oxidoreductase [Candidatus Microgenomates bacterium]
MKILITGDKGYLGKEFVERHGKDYKIVGFDLVDGDDLLDYEKLIKKMKGCSQVVHLAAIPAPVEGKSFKEYFDNNVRGTFNITRAAYNNRLKRIIYASSTTYYGIEKGIPFQTPIKEDQKVVSQYIKANQLSCRAIDLSYHVSKVMAEQVMAWYGLNKKIETAVLRFGPINKVFLGTSISINNACQAIKLALDYQSKLWHEAFSIVDDLEHISNAKAKKILGYKPEKPKYSKDQIHSLLGEKKA